MTHRRGHSVTGPHVFVRYCLQTLALTPCCRAQQAGENGKLTGKQYFLQMDGRTRDGVRAAQLRSIKLDP